MALDSIPYRRDLSTKHMAHIHKTVCFFFSKELLFLQKKKKNKGGYKLNLFYCLWQLNDKKKQSKNEICP